MGWNGFGSTLTEWDGIGAENLAREDLTPTRTRVSKICARRPGSVRGYNLIDPDHPDRPGFQSSDIPPRQGSHLSSPQQLSAALSSPQQL